MLQPESGPKSAANDQNRFPNRLIQLTLKRLPLRHRTKTIPDSQSQISFVCILRIELNGGSDHSPGIQEECGIKRLMISEVVASILHESKPVQEICQSGYQEFPVLPAEMPDIEGIHRGKVAETALQPLTFHFQPPFDLGCPQHSGAIEIGEQAQQQCDRRTGWPFLPGAGFSVEFCSHVRGCIAREADDLVFCASQQIIHNAHMVE
jgi:hypothetical protein